MTALQALDRTVLIARDFVPVEVSDVAIATALCSTTASLVADERNLSSLSGQVALATLATLLLQSGCRLQLVFPEVGLMGHQPPLRGSNLRQSIVELARDLIPGGLATAAEQTSAGEMVFVLGDTPWAGDALLAYRVHGGRWSGSVSPAAAEVLPWCATTPIGALAAAAIAAAEPFKAALRRLLGPAAAKYVELAPIKHATVALGPEDLDVTGIDIGRVECVSGGAIVQAFAHALFRVPGIRGALGVIEPERLEPPNLNRYPLSLRSQLGLLKAELISVAAPADLRVAPTMAYLDRGSAGDFLGSDSKVIVGTDNISSRWVAQSTSPAWLAVGATAKFLAVSSEHAPGLACARCMHPSDDDVDAPIATVSFVSYWGGLMLAARLLRQAAGLACDRDEQALSLAALHLDGRHAQWRHQVRSDSACPLRCAMASQAAPGKRAGRAA